MARKGLLRPLCPACGEPLHKGFPLVNGCPGPAEGPLRPTLRRRGLAWGLGLLASVRSRRASWIVWPPPWRTSPASKILAEVLAECVLAKGQQDGPPMSAFLRLVIEARMFVHNYHRPRSHRKDLIRIAAQLAAEGAGRPAYLTQVIDSLGSPWP